MSSSTTTQRHWSLQQRAFTNRGSFASLIAGQSPLVAPAPQRKRGQRLDAWMRRALNVCVAAVAIVLTAPLMLIVAIAIKLTSPGPVIYKQPRVGLDRRQNRGPGSENHRRSVDHGGRVFSIYKFRTMTVDGGAHQIWSSKDDPRITTVGRFLRATRIDEIPQFFNVLKGDMNIVGPRPEQPRIFAELRRELADYSHRQRVLPGITGLAQVNLGYDTSVEDVKRKVALDLEYIQRSSATADLLIMAKTMPVMVLRKGWM